MNNRTHALQAAAQRLSGSDRRRTLGVVIAVAGAISMSIGLVSQPAVADESYVCPAGNYLSWTDTFDPAVSVVVVPNFDIVYIGFGHESGGHTQVGDGTSMRGQTIPVPGEPATDAHWCKADVDSTTTTAAPTTTVPVTTTTVPVTTTTVPVTTTTVPVTTTTTIPVTTTTTTIPVTTTTSPVTTTTSPVTTTTTPVTTTTTTTIPVTTTSSEIGGPTTTTTTTTTTTVSPTTSSSTTTTHVDSIPTTSTTISEVFPPTTTIPSTSLAVELPRTGTDSARAFMTFGALMMLMGGVLVLRSRRDYEFG